MMKKVIRTSGRRIRKTDENLIFHTILSLCLGIFIVVLICFYGKRLSQINWSEVNLKKIGSMRPTPYFFTAISIAAMLCILVIFLFYKYKRDVWKQLVHRQALARMILENGW